MTSKLWCGVVSLFPEMFGALTNYGITARAVKQGQLTVQAWNPRDFTTDPHRTVDDRVYGGGPGMVMKPEPLTLAIAEAKAAAPSAATVVCLAPSGKRFDQACAQRLSQAQALVLVCGRYEGIDQRVLDQSVDEVISIGDYVISGGELAAMVMMDAMTRLLPGVLGHAEGAEQDSFMQGLLEYPQYTRPPTFDGMAVPSVLLSGHEANIRQWRQAQALKRTLRWRPDLLEQRPISEEEKDLLALMCEE